MPLGDSGLSDLRVPEGQMHLRLQARRPRRVLAQLRSRELRSVPGGNDAHQQSVPMLQRLCQTAVLRLACRCTKKFLN
ncbi:unnamed protein product, partial [Ixodes pacificus]